MSNVDQELVLAYFIVTDDVERSRRFYTETTEREGFEPSMDETAHTGFRDRAESGSETP